MKWLIILGCVAVLIAASTAGILLYLGSIGTEDAWDKVQFGEVLEYAERSVAAYAADDVIREKYGGGSLWITDLPDVDVKVFVERDDAARVQWIAVRGTANLQNALIDGDYDKEDDPKLGIRLHHGFGKSARAAYEAIRPNLDKDYKTRITGHSLGGAVAAILLLDCVTDGYQIDKCITFGQPKVTNFAGVAKFHHLPLLRVVHHRDLVALVPPVTFVSASGGIYRHFGPEVILDEGDCFLYLAEHDAERALVQSAWTRLGHLSVDDHSMLNYQKCLVALTQRQENLPNNER